jgi:hypothetical protein
MSSAPTPAPANKRPSRLIRNKRPTGLGWVLGIVLLLVLVCIIAAIASPSKPTAGATTTASAVAKPSPSQAAVVKPSAPAKPPAGPTLTASQQQAALSAENYLAIGSGFSYQGLIDQLDSSSGSGFSIADATAAVNSLNLNYNAQAVLAAKSYIKTGAGFSHAALVAQLDSAYGSKFTAAQAEYGATAAGL